MNTEQVWIRENREDGRLGYYHQDSCFIVEKFNNRPSTTKETAFHPVPISKAEELEIPECPACN